MADYDYVDKSTGTDYYGEGVCSAYTSKHFIWKRHISFAVAGDALVSSTGAFTSSDTVAIFNVVEGMMLNYVLVEVITAEGGTCTVDIGDGTDPDGYLMAVDFNAATWYQPDSTYGGKYLGGDTPTNYVGYTYAAADTIDIDFGHTTDDTVADFWIAGVYFNPIYVA